MGGRKGYSLRKIVGSIKNVREEKKALLDAIEREDVADVVGASAKILAKSDKTIESLAHSFLFVGSIDKKEAEKLAKKSTKERRAELSKKWVKYRKAKGKSFDPSVSRDIVDTATKTLGEDK